MVDAAQDRIFGLEERPVAASGVYPVELARNHPPFANHTEERRSGRRSIPFGCIRNRAFRDGRTGRVRMLPFGFLPGREEPQRAGVIRPRARSDLDLGDFL